MSPFTISVSEAQYLKIAAAAQWVCPADRYQFWEGVAAELRGHELGDGFVTRAITKAFRQSYKTLQLPSAPKSRAWPPTKPPVQS
jgi:hypothetical protein